jgi:hypothetical protein
MRVYSRSLLALTFALAALRATTLEQLTLDEMIQQSTSIVRARVGGSRTAYRGAGIYTFYQLAVLETWKSPSKSGGGPTEIAVPGGVVEGVRQIATGAPDLKPGQEYVLFLWTSRSGLTQVMGLSQGRFHVHEEMAQRPPAAELMLDRSGRPVEDQALNLRLKDLQAQVAHTLRAAK